MLTYVWGGYVGVQGETFDVRLCICLVWGDYVGTQ
jgi:hypothetical protein